MRLARKKTQILRASSAVFYLCFLFYITLVPHPQIIPKGNNFITRLLANPIVHAPTNFILDLNPGLAFIGNMVLFIPVIPILRTYTHRLSLELDLLICALLPALIEFCQQWIPGRVPSLSDYLLNFSGILLMYLTAKFKKGADK